MRGEIGKFLNKSRKDKLERSLLKNYSTNHAVLTINEYLQDANVLKVLCLNLIFL